MPDPLVGMVIGAMTGPGARFDRIPGQALRFVIAGGAVALVYVAVTITLADGLGAPFQIALAIGFAAAICTHFSLQRVFVWRDEDAFALGIRQQVTRYALVAGAQYAVTAAATAVLPGALGVPVTLVYVITVCILSALNFLVFRTVVFHTADSAD